MNTLGQRIWLLARAVVPLLAVGLIVLAGPTLVVWWLSGEPLGWRHILIGGVASVALLAVGALLFGWAVGRAPK